MNIRNSLSFNIKKLFNYHFIFNEHTVAKLYRVDPGLKGFLDSYNLKESPLYGIIRNLDCNVANIEIYKSKEESLKASYVMTRISISISNLDAVFNDDCKKNILELDFTGIPKIEILPPDFSTVDLKLIVDVTKGVVVLPTLVKYCKDNKVDIYNSLVPISVESDLSFMFALVAKESSIYSIPLKNGVGKFNLFLQDSMPSDSPGAEDITSKSIQKVCKVVDFSSHYIVFSNATSNRISQNTMIFKNFLVYSNTDTNV